MLQGETICEVSECASGGEPKGARAAGLASGETYAVGLPEVLGAGREHQGPTASAVAFPYMVADVNNKLFTDRTRHLRP